MVDVSEHNESGLVRYVVLDDDDDGGGENVTRTNVRSFISLSCSDARHHGIPRSNHSTVSPRHPEVQLQYRITKVSRGPSSHSIKVTPHHGISRYNHSTVSPRHPEKP